MDYYLIFANIIVATALIPIGIGLTGWRKLGVEVRLLLLLAGVSFTTDVLSYILYVFHANNNVVGNIYRLLDFSILYLIFFRIFAGKKIRIILVLVGVVCIVFMILNFVFVQKESLNTYNSVSSSIIFIVLSVSYFYKLLQDMPMIRLSDLPMFWIAVAALVYYSGNLFLFLTTHEFIVILKENLRVLWTVNGVLTLIRNLLFSRAVYAAVKSKELPL